MASNWFDENQPNSGNMGTPVSTQSQQGPDQGATTTGQPGGTLQGDADYKTEFMQAVQELGIDPHQLRANPALMDKVSSYLTQKYPGQQWANGGQRAGDWFSVNGQGFDVLPAGDSNYQWLSDPANSQAGNPNDPSGFQTGTFTGGGKYPLASVMGTGLAQPWTTPFQAPDPNTFTNDKPLQWQMEQGTNAITRGLAKNGTLLTGGAAKALDRYGQGVASQYYGDAYNRALGEYQNAYGIFNNNQGNLFNRLSSLGNTGENAAAGVGNVQIGAGDARAQGSIAQGNIWGNAINNGVGAGLQYLNQRSGQPNQGTVYDYGANGSVNVIQPGKG